VVQALREAFDQRGFADTDGALDGNESGWAGWLCVGSTNG
jgi:hypothetical protein